MKAIILLLLTYLSANAQDNGRLTIKNASFIYNEALKNLLLSTNFLGVDSIENLAADSSDHITILIDSELSEFYTWNFPKKEISPYVKKQNLEKLFSHKVIFNMGDFFSITKKKNVLKYSNNEPYLKVQFSDIVMSEKQFFLIVDYSFSEKDTDGHFFSLEDRIGIEGDVFGNKVFILKYLYYKLDNQHTARLSLKACMLQQID